MRKHIQLWIFCLIFTISCSTNDDPKRIALNSSERALIPFDSEVLLDFIDADGEVLSVLASARQLDEVFASSSGSDPQELELMSNRLTLLGGELDFIIQVGKTVEGETNFFIRDQFEQQKFNATQCQSTVLNLEVHLKNVNIGDTLYTQVFDFRICDENEASDLGVSRIVYSIQRGIEYIQFENGDFLKQL